MRILLPLLLVALLRTTHGFHLAVASAATRETPGLDDFAGLPACGFKCALPIFVELKCNLANFTTLSECLCPNIQAEYDIAYCVMSNCSYSDLMEVQEAQATFCADQPQPSRQRDMVIASIIFTCIIVVSVALRCWSRYSISKKFWWDDWFLIVSAAFMLGLQAVIIWGTRLGCFRHIWNVDPNLNPQLYLMLWSYEILYCIVQNLTKISLLLLYFRIFPQHWLQTTCTFLCYVMALQGVCFVFAIIFQCHPVALNYNKFLEGKCISFHPISFAGAVFSIVEDITILSLPIPSILKLRLRMGRKIGVVLVMSVGLVACIASIVRLKYVVSFYGSIDQLWDNYSMALVSMIELSLSITCACFPATKPLLNKWFPKWFLPSGPQMLSLQLPESTTGSGKIKSAQGFQSMILSLLGRLKPNVTPHEHDLGEHQVPNEKADLKSESTVVNTTGPKL